MPRFEYRFSRFVPGVLSSPSDDELTSDFVTRTRKLGEEGWEFCGHVPLSKGGIDVYKRQALPTEGETE